MRTTETIDQTVAVKFVAISFIGEAIGVMRKAQPLLALLVAQRATVRGPGCNHTSPGLQPHVIISQALISTLRGDITAAFDPYHCELLNVSTKEEVSVEAVAAQLGAMFGGEVQRQAGPEGGQGASMRIGQRMVKVTLLTDSTY